MNIEERAAAAAELKATGKCNCTQSVVKVFEDKLPISVETLMKLTAGYAVGMGCMESTCGALIGAVMVAGMQNHFKLYVKQSGISDANFHALRHTFATRCVEVGFEIKSLSEILGHASVNITLNRYVHSSFELKRFNMSKLIF